MDGRVVFLHIEIADLIKRHAENLAAALERERAAVAAQLRRGAVEHLEELFLADGLYEIVQRRHVVPLGDVVRVAGDENDLHGGVLRADAPGHRHAVHAAHLDIEQQKVKILVLVVGEEERLGGGEHLERDALFPALAPFADILRDELRILGAVVADSGSHILPPHDVFSIVFNSQTLVKLKMCMVY